MKRIIGFSFLLVVLFSVLTVAQSSWPAQKNSTSSYGKYDHSAVGDSVIPWSMLVANDAVTALAFSDTTNKTMVRDTLSRRQSWTTNNLKSIFKRWFRYSVSTDDTIDVSSDPTFPKNKTFTLQPGEAYTSERRDVSIFLNLYYRVKGWGIATTRWIVEGL